jgi:(2Fe-2S) ferredoxin
MTIYEKHVFVCENERDPTNPIGCCLHKDSKKITEALKKLCQNSTLKGKVRINKAGCLGQCAKGPVVVVYPEGTWYRNVSVEDVEEIFFQHLMNNQIVERLKL